MSDPFVDKAQWEAFCNRLSRQLEGAQAEIEVAALGLGDQIEAEWVPLRGISYDPKDDVFEIAVENLDHLIHKPRSLAVQREGAKVESLAVETESGDRHIVRLREPLALPAPEGAAR
jgi:hypothetical protein